MAFALVKMDDYEALLDEADVYIVEFDVYNKLVNKDLEEPMKDYLPVLTKLAKKLVYPNKEQGFVSRWESGVTVNDKHLLPMKKHNIKAEDLAGIITTISLICFNIAYPSDRDHMKVFLDLDVKDDFYESIKVVEKILNSKEVEIDVEILIYNKQEKI